jgi:hypothetical protein
MSFANLTKRMLIFMGAEYFGKTITELAILTRMSIPAATKARLRGEALAMTKDLRKLIS